METARVEVITPEIAREYLKFNTINRPLNKLTVKFYAEQMRKGLWKLNGEAIVFAKGGSLVNGQHRLSAVIEAKCEITTFVVRGVDFDVFATYDTGRNRSAGDVFSLAGIPNSVQISAIVNRALSLRRTNNFLCVSNKVSAKNSTKASRSELIEEYNSSRDIYEDALVVANKCLRVINIMSKTEVGALYAYLVKFRMHDQNKTERFFYEMFGICEATSNAPSLLRAKLLKDKTGVKDFKMTVRQKSGLITKAWNCYITGKEIKRLDYNEEKEGILCFL